MDNTSSVNTLAIAGKGGSVGYSGAVSNIEITASGRTIVLEGMTSDAITITGSNNTILLKGDADTVSVLRGSGNRITLSARSARWFWPARTPRLTAPARSAP